MLLLLFNTLLFLFTLSNITWKHKLYNYVFRNIWNHEWTPRTPRCADSHSCGRNTQALMTATRTINNAQEGWVWKPLRVDPLWYTVDNGLVRRALKVITLWSTSRDTRLYFYQNINKIFLIKIWYILCFYFSTIEHYFYTAGNLYLLKLN